MTALVSAFGSCFADFAKSDALIAFFLVDVPALTALYFNETVRATEPLLVSGVRVSFAVPAGMAASLVSMTAANGLPTLTLLIVWLPNTVFTVTLSGTVLVFVPATISTAFS